MAPSLGLLGDPNGARTALDIALWLRQPSGPMTRRYWPTSTRCAAHLVQPILAVRQCPAESGSDGQTTFTQFCPSPGAQLGLNQIQGANSTAHRLNSASAACNFSVAVARTRTYAAFLPSTSTNSMRQVSVPRLLHACMVAHCISTSPALSSVSFSSMTAKISPESTMA